MVIYLTCTSLAFKNASIDKLYINIVYTHTISLTRISTTVPQYTFQIYAFSTAVLLTFKNASQAIWPSVDKLFHSTISTSLPQQYNITIFNGNCSTF